MSRNFNSNPSSGAVYGLGLIGAAVYFISHATGFWMGVLGFLKAIVWPAFLIYEAIKRACLQQNTNTFEQNHASSIRPLKINFVRMKHLNM